MNNANHDLLEKALKEQGYTVVRKGDSFTFSKGSTTGSYQNNKLTVQTSYGTKVDIDALKKSYAEQVVKKRVQEFRAKGWYAFQDEKTGDMVLSKTPQAKKVTA